MYVLCIARVTVMLYRDSSSVDACIHYSIDCPPSLMNEWAALASTKETQRNPRLYALFVHLHVVYYDLLQKLLILPEIYLSDPED